MRALDAAALAALFRSPLELTLISKGSGRRKCSDVGTAIVRSVSRNGGHSPHFFRVLSNSRRKGNLRKVLKRYSTPGGRLVNLAFTTHAEKDKILAR